MTREIVLAGVWMLGSVALSAADAPAAFNWKTVLPTVQRVVRHTFLKESANAHYLPAIVETADVTGAGRQEALVDLGSGGYTADMTVMVLEGDTPVLAKFRRDDKLGPMVFMRGLSDDKGEAVELRPKEHAVFAGHWVVKAGKVKDCHGELYQWDNGAKNFGYEKKLTKVVAREFCANVEAKGGAAPNPAAAPAAAPVPDASPAPAEAPVAAAPAAL